MASMIKTSLLNQLGVTLLERYAADRSAGNGRSYRRKDVREVLDKAHRARAWRHNAQLIMEDTK